MSPQPSATMPHPNEQLHLQTQSAEPKACLEHEENAHHQHLHKTPISTSKWSRNTKPSPDNIMAYQDAWVGWDGPVWCSRYGRFENQEDAAHDDGYPSDPKSPVHEDRRLHRCEKSTHHSAHVPAQHQFYVNDIKRRVEPMAQSLVQLEHQVQRLVRHVMKDGQTFYRTGSFHDDGKNGGTIALHHGEMGDPLHAPIVDHNNSGEIGGILEPNHPLAIDSNASLDDLVQQPNPTSAAVNYSTPPSHGTPQELSHLRDAHDKEGFNQENSPPERIEKFREGYNQEWSHYERVRKEHTEPMREAIRKLEGQVEILSRQMRIIIGREDGPREEKGSMAGVKT